MSYYHYHESTHLSQQNALALRSLAATGELPSTHYWNTLRTQHDANAARFDRTHNYVVAALLDRDQAQRAGTLSAASPLFSNTGFFAYASAKHTLAAARFDYYHPFLGHLFEISLPATLPATGAQGLNPPTTIPTSPPVQTPGNDLPPGGTGTGGTGGGPATPSIVPEPASVILMSVALVIALVGTYWKSRADRAATAGHAGVVGA